MNGLLPALLLVTACASVQEDFEKGMPKGWQPAPGQETVWDVVEEPGNPTNHVLSAKLSGAGSSLTFGESMRNCRLTARFKFVDFRGQYFHVKFACRANEPGSSCYLNMRSDGPIIVLHSGQDFTVLARLGDIRPEPDTWHDVEFSCRGPILHGIVKDSATADVVAEGRCYEDTLKAGRQAFMIHLPSDASGTFLFDDIEITPLGEDEVVQVEKHVIQNDMVRLVFNATLGLFELTDLRTKRTWKPSTRTATIPLVKKVSKSLFGKGLNIEMNTPAGPVKASIKLERSEVLVKVKPVGKGKYVPLVFPAPVLPSTNSELVLPTDEGLLLPVAAVNMPRVASRYGYSQGGLLMPWYGILEGESGVMAMFETADDWHLDVRKAKESGAPILLPVLSWAPSKTDLRYERRVRLCLFAEGGYVAMAKRYRTFLMDSGRFRTIEEKAKEIPNVRKLIGAINILDHSGDDTFLDWMIKNDIKHALYSCGHSKERVKKALDAGYVVNRYDIYTDVAGPELLAYRGKPKSELDKSRIGYPDECFIMRDGKPMPGFAYPIGAKGGVDPKGKDGLRVRCYKRCSACQLHWMKKIIPKQIEESGYTARFIDVETAHPPYECYSEKHPLTRTEDIQTRLKLFDYLRSLGQVCSSEGGADYAAHALHYQEGSLTLTRLGGIPGVYVGTTPFKLPDDYVRWQFDPTIRAPLHELVHHDQQWMTWRWNHTPNRWDKRQYWDDWDLIHIINAQMPIFVVRADYLKDQGERILKTHRDVCGVLQKVGGVEMTHHKFLTKDRMVQESQFANGWRVIVNFNGDKPYERRDRKPVGPKSFVMERFE